MTDQSTKTQSKQAWRIAKIVGNVIFYVLITLIIVAGIIGIVGKYKGNGQGLGLFGYNFYVVATPSMSRVNDEHKDFLAGHDDQIQVGDLIVTRKLKDGQQLHVYDVVTFVQGGNVIVHRIVDITVGSDGTVYYTTRGDANNASDGQRTIDEFTGILVTNAGHGWGEAVKFAQSYYGIAAVAGVIAIILLAILVNDSLQKREPKPKEPDDAGESKGDGESNTDPAQEGNPQQEEGDEKTEE